MLWSSSMQLPSHRKVQHWKNENKFLQAREDNNGSTVSETILVGLRHDEDGFQLLSWVINVAARPGDTVIVLHLNQNGAKVENLIGRSQSETSEDQEAAHTQLKALLDLCEVRKTQIVFRFALSADKNLELIEEASSVRATMLVISPPPCRSVLWSSQRKGNFLTQRVPSGCAVIIVRDYKVLFYKEKACQDSKGCSSSFFEAWRSMGSYQSLQRQFSSTSSSLWGRDKGDEMLDSDTKIVPGSKLWPKHNAGEDSPRGVLDDLGLSVDLDSSPPSSTYSSLSRSVSQNGLLACVLPQEDGNDSFRMQPTNCLSLRRNKTIRRTQTFPPAHCLKKFSGPLDYMSMRNSFKSYVNTLWGTDSMSHDKPMSANVQQNWRSFFYEELVFATNDFNTANLVGKGGHAEVYKGTLIDGRIIAIKRLTKGRSVEIKEQDFLTELGIIGHVAHPNTTPLVGFCVEEGLHLIFDYSSNGSLATWLHGVSNPVLDWSARYKVAVGTARGLHYLHTACPRRIIHRDIKASNILLSPDFEPQISDFGLAKWLPDQRSQLTVFPVEGTFGYLAPEYFMYGIMDEKTDVFAFGVLLLELITGRQPIDNLRQSLVIWAKPLLESSRVEELADPKLNGAFDRQEMQTMVLVAGLCVQSSALCRPYMGQILELLTEENSESFSLSCSRSDSFEDSSEEYYSTTYHSDLSRHREIALQF